MNMRRSRVLEALRAGRMATSFKMNLADARAVEIAAMAGFDCIWLDMEHVPNDFSVIEQGIWAAKGRDTDVMVRVARGGYSDYIRPLEMDAAGIMVPHVMGAADALAVSRMTRFHPVGRRPLDGGNADGAYCAMGLAEYLRQANDQRFVVVQIEDPEPMEELDAIAAVPGIDMLFFGPGDYSHGVGAPGAWDDPRLLDARQRVAKAALAHGKYAGTVATPSNIDDLIGLGYRFLNMGSDVTGLAQHCRNIAAEFAKRQTRITPKGNTRSRSETDAGSSPASIYK